MKLRNRLLIAFLTITIIPIILSVTLVVVFAKLQLGAIDKTYGISGMTVESLSNSTEVLARLAEKPFHELRKTVKERPGHMEDATYLKEFNQKLKERKTYLLVRKEDTIIFIGTESDESEHVLNQLPAYGAADTSFEKVIYFSGEAQSLVRQIDFQYPDGKEGSAFVVTDISNMIPEIEQFFVDMLFSIVIVLIFSACLLVVWIYRGVMGPLKKMRAATENIKEGNLDFELCPEADDELGQLCMDLEDMRKRLKSNAEEKVVFDRENKELISNISHDLKTPVTAIKGYAEGIMDGVADTPEKMERYLRDFQDTQYFASRYFNHGSVFYIGRNLDYAMGLEGSLKLKEISYIHSEAYASGELKHGTISLVEDNTLVIGVLTQSNLYEKTISNMAECKARGAYLMGLTCYGHYSIEDTADFTVYIPKTAPCFTGLLAIVPLQLLGYYTSVARGLDVDKPRNLAKSVTVE